MLFFLIRDDLRYCLEYVEISTRQGSMRIDYFPKDNNPFSVSFLNFENFPVRLGSI